MVSLIAIVNDRANGLKNDEKEVRMMCKAVQEYADKYAKEQDIQRIQSLAENGVSIDIVISSFPDVSEKEIQRIFENITKK